MKKAIAVVTFIIEENDGTTVSVLGSYRKLSGAVKAVLKETASIERELTLKSLRFNKTEIIDSNLDVEVRFELDNGTIWRLQIDVVDLK